MNAPRTSNLLRRTAAALAAVATFHVAADSQAAQITLSSGTASCTFGQMLVTPSGDLSVQCTSSAPPAASHGGTFRLSATATMIPVSSTGNLSVVRETGNTGAVNVSYSIVSTTAGSCTGATGTISFADGSYVASAAIPVTTLATTGTCTVSLGNPSNSVTPTTPSSLVSGQSTATITVAPPNTCAAPPGNMLTADLGAANERIRPMGLTTQLTSIQLPTVPLTRLSGIIRVARDTVTPVGTVLEFAISRCPGVIDPTVVSTPATSGCYFRQENPMIAGLTWFVRANSTWTTAQISTARACNMPIADGPAYLNIRYTFPGGGTGGYVFQWALGN